MSCARPDLWGPWRRNPPGLPDKVDVRSSAPVVWADHGPFVEQRPGIEAERETCWRCANPHRDAALPRALDALQEGLLVNAQGFERTVGAQASGRLDYALNGVFSRGV